MPDDHDEAADLADTGVDDGASDPDGTEPGEDGPGSGAVTRAPRPTMWSLLGAGRRPGRTAPVRTEDVARGMKRLDERERKWGLGAVALLIAGALALYVPRLSHNTTVSTALKKVHGSWPPHSGCTAAQKTCSALTVYHPSYFLLPALLAFALIALLVLGLVRSMRTLSIFTAFLAGLALGGSILSTLGAFAWGIWVLARSWRLSKYGTKDAKAASQVSKERLAERKESKRTRATAATSPAGRPHPERSKRYTPAKSARQAKR